MQQQQQQQQSAASAAFQLTPTQQDEHQKWMSWLANVSSDHLKVEQLMTKEYKQLITFPADMKVKDALKVRTYYHISALLSALFLVLRGEKNQ